MYANELNLFGKPANHIFLISIAGGDTSIILIEKNELILNNRKIATTFNDYFPEIRPSLNLFKWPGNVKSLASNRDIIDHPSIKMIKNKFTKIAKFSFHQVMLNPHVGIFQLILWDNVICVSKP